MPSLPRMAFGALAALAALSPAVAADTKVFNWTTGWGNYDADGMLERPVITCNGQFPWPDVRVNKGDTVLIYLTNGFNDRNTSLHLHGLFQRGTNQMDGPPGVTQCPIGPGDTFLYNFTVDSNVGTYWYHSHTAGQYQDGFRGVFIIEDDAFPYHYDYDIPLQIGEWYHDTTDVLIPTFMNLYNPTGAEPIPQNFILNSTRNLTWNVEPDKTYLLRLVNTGGFVSQYFWIEDHNMTVVEVDGVYTEQNTTDMIYITTAQRYSVLVHTKNDTSRNFAIMNKVDDTMLDVVPSDLELNSTSYMVYNSSAALPKQNIVQELEFLDDFYLVPYEKQEVLPEPDYTITVDVMMDNLISGVNYAFFNNLTWTSPKVPTLLTVLSAGENATDASIYGSNVNAFVLEKDEVIELVLNNRDTGTHPFHLHGHTFQALVRDREYNADLGEQVHLYNSSDHPAFPEYPMIRDTLYVRPQSNFVIRFKADNPGVWFFHCHIEWHLLQGLAIVLIEDPLGIQQNASQALSDNHRKCCQNLGVPIEGNAAGNSADFFDLAGENVQEKSIPPGFTKKGIVAMFFSCLAGVLGLVTIGVYGLMGMNNAEERVMADFDISPDEVLQEASRDDDNTNHSSVEKEVALETVETKH
ncbi:LAMI_0E01156g1_1 [Lachancea mirantina]|uniref:LAMI_0E01156g1_1 n=1 Tax=Lachancea mirantina TaxID=1230905 RepID=A0A1G4JIF4_9SACH|nr:LAMI_0E01156g1_1 [Lachancea mirantina]